MSSSSLHHFQPSYHNEHYYQQLCLRAHLEVAIGFLYHLLHLGQDAHLTHLMDPLPHPTQHLVGQGGEQDQKRGVLGVLSIRVERSRLDIRSNSFSKPVELWRRLVVWCCGAPETFSILSGWLDMYCSLPMALLALSAVGGGGSS